MCGRGLTVDGRTAEGKEKTPSLNCILEEECSSEAQETLAKTPKQKLPDAQRLINAHTLVECEAVRRSGEASVFLPHRQASKGEGRLDVRRKRTSRLQHHLESSCTAASRSCRRRSARCDVTLYHHFTPNLKVLSAGCCDKES